jgi:hypothetical protein
VPAELVEGFALRVHLGGDNPLVLLQLDGAFLLEVEGGPLPAVSSKTPSPV